jgi:hypothetical protein
MYQRSTVDDGSNARQMFSSTSVSSGDFIIVELTSTSKWSEKWINGERILSSRQKLPENGQITQLNSKLGQ